MLLQHKDKLHQIWLDSETKPTLKTTRRVIVIMEIAVRRAQEMVIVPMLATAETFNAITVTLPVPVTVPTVQTVVAQPIV